MKTPRVPRIACPINTPAFVVDTEKWASRKEMAPRNSPSRAAYVSTIAGLSCLRPKVAISTSASPPNAPMKVNGPASARLASTMK